MNDKPAILVGLVIFLAVVTFPIWYTFGAANLFSVDTSPPDLEAPAGALKFSAEWSKDDLDLADLREEFESHQIPALSAAASLTADSQGGRWRLVDQQRRYLVLKDQGMLKVYDGCVEEVNYMQANHMALLIEWRDAVVRQGDTSRIEINGRSYLKSLTTTCMGCHTDRQTFCYRCHVYANTLPAWPARNSSTAQGGIRCWNCHLQPEEEVNDG